jgi:O-antigen ligase
MAALVLVAMLSTSWARQQQVAARELRTVFVESALFYALIRLAARSPRARWRVLEGWLLGATMIALVGIGQLLAGQNLISAEGVWRVRGLYGSPNNLALYLERAWPVLLAMVWQGTGSARPDRLRRITYGLAVLPVLAALILTQSKGALLVGLPSAAVALVAFQVSRRRAWAVAVALAVIALILLPLALSGRLQGIADLDQGTGSARLKLWRSALAMIADHPLTGVGLDNFLYAYRTRYVLPSAWQEPDLSHPHNLILDTWTRLGVGGLAVMAWLLVAYFRGAWLQFRAATGQRRALLLGLLAAMVALVAHGMVDHAVYVVDLAFVFALLLAMVGR